MAETAQAEDYLLFVPSPQGYELVERSGEVPLVDAEVEVEGQRRRLVVAKLGPSPLPADPRRCAFLIEAP